MLNATLTANPKIEQFKINQIYTPLNTKYTKNTLSHQVLNITKKITYARNHNNVKNYDQKMETLVKVLNTNCTYLLESPTLTWYIFGDGSGVQFDKVTGKLLSTENTDIGETFRLVS